MVSVRELGVAACRRATWQYCRYCLGNIATASRFDTPPPPSSDRKSDPTLPAPERAQ
jgi:hypothetical protein